MSTKRLTTRLRDPKEWDVVLPDVPIFVEHSMYELPNGESIALLPGKSPPAGATLKYQVDEARLASISKQINEDLERHDCPIKLRDGHTKHGAAQKDQPPVVGYGAKTRVTTWNDIKAITTPLHYEKGYGHLAQERPERSPEYRFRKNSIPDVALLATEPRLKMGMTHRYEAADDIIRYAMGMDAIAGDPASAADPNDPTTLQPGNATSFTPEEVQKVKDIWNHLCATEPVLGWLQSQFKDAQAAPGQEPLPPSPGSTLPLAPPGPLAGGAPESQPYAEDAMNQQEADALRAELEATKKKLAEHEKRVGEESAKYAESDTARWLDKVVNYEHDHKETKSLMLATDGPGREKIALRIQNFHKPKAGASTAPVGGMLPVDTTPETENYADTDPPSELYRTVAAEKGLNPAVDWKQIETEAKKRFKAARAVRN